MQFVFRSYLGAFDPTASRLLGHVESIVEDPVVVDNTGMTEVDEFPKGSGSRRGNSCYSKEYSKPSCSPTRMDDPELSSLGT